MNSAIADLEGLIRSRGGGSGEAHFSDISKKPYMKFVNQSEIIQAIRKGDCLYYDDIKRVVKMKTKYPINDYECKVILYNLQLWKHMCYRPKRV